MTLRLIHALSAALAAALALLSAGPVFAQTATYQIVDDGIPDALTSTPGNAARGKALLIKREQATCLKCHTISQAELPGGSKGPSLDGIGANLTKAQIRLTVADPTRITRGTDMPSFHKNGAPEPKLTAQEVEDIVAFLSTLRR